MNIRVSVVVPTYKRPDLLRKCLEALASQKFPGDAYEVIVVDDAGSDETRLLVESFPGEKKPVETAPASRSGPETGACPRFRYAAATQTRGPAAARNLGWRMARGEIIAFTDDDCQPEPDWLKEGLSALEEGAACVTGKVIVPISEPPTDNEKNVFRLQEGEFLTANCFFRRSALEISGGFDERFTMAWREDSDLQFRLLELSLLIVDAPGARVIHPVREAPWGISLREQRKSMYNALLFKKYPGLYRKRIQPLPPLRYYAIVLSATGAVAALSLGYGYIALLLALTWLLLTLGFAYDRLRGTQHTPAHILEMIVTSVLIPPMSIFWRLYGAFYYRVFFL